MFEEEKVILKNYLREITNALENSSLTPDCYGECIQLKSDLQNELKFINEQILIGKSLGLTQFEKTEPNLLHILFPFVSWNYTPPFFFKRVWNFIWFLIIISSFLPISMILLIINPARNIEIGVFAICWFFWCFAWISTGRCIYFYTKNTSIARKIIYYNDNLDKTNGG